LWADDGTVSLAIAGDRVGRQGACAVPVDAGHLPADVALHRTAVRLGDPPGAVAGGAPGRNVADGDPAWRLCPDLAAFPRQRVGLPVAVTHARGHLRVLRSSRAVQRP